MIFEGMIDEAVKIVAAARDRHDGYRRNPFDEAECGHHYARAMASWGCFIAATGFGYDGGTRTMSFAAAQKPTKWFWSSGDAWGIVKQSAEVQGIRLAVEALGGTLRLARISLTGFGAATLAAETELNSGQTVEVMIPRSRG